MSVTVPTIDEEGGVKSGVGSGTATPPSATNPVSVAAAQPGSPQRTLQTRWRPPSFLDMHRRMSDPTQGPQVAREIDTAIQRAYQNDSQLETMQACRQFGKTVVTGSSLSIPTGLATVTFVVASIDNGAAAHNFWLSASVSQQPGCIDLRVWKPTAAGDTTPIAGTVAVTVQWFVQGTLA